MLAYSDDTDLSAGWLLQLLFQLPKMHLTEWQKMAQGLPVLETQEEFLVPGISLDQSQLLQLFREWKTDRRPSLCISSVFLLSSAFQI